MSERGRPRKDPKEVKESVSAALRPEAIKELEAVAWEFGVSRSYVIEQIIERGMARFRQDGILREPTQSRVVQMMIVEPKDQPPSES